MNTKSVMAMVSEAKQRIENLSVADVMVELAANNVTLIDIREASELQSGMIPGAVSAPRGMLEFYADVNSPYHRAEFAPERRMIVYCASGGRSALATDTLQQLGYIDVAHLDGGFKAWQAAEMAVETAV